LHHFAISCTTASLTAHATPIVLGLVDLAHAPLMRDSMLKDVRDSGITAGDVG
jgi:hypothetical protein